MNTSLVSITLNHKVFQLLCKLEEEKELKSLSHSLNNRIIDIKTANPSASFELLLVMAALSLQEDFNKTSVNPPQINSNPEVANEKNELLNMVILSLEKLANKFEK